MTRKQRNTRIGILIHQLAALSRNGWRNARPCDYVPLEQELRQLLADRKRLGNARAA